jgi:cbb3-type cytochrome oxidase subunit 1
VETGLVYAHGLTAILMLFASLIFGIMVSVELLWPDLLSGSPWLSWGRLRYDHTQGIMLGWLANAFFAFLYHSVPVMTGRPVTSARLGHWLFGLWNFVVVIPGWVLVLAGFSQPLEWAEFPLVIDVFVVFALLVTVIQFLPPFFARGVDPLPFFVPNETGDFGGQGPPEPVWRA